MPPKKPVKGAPVKKPAAKGATATGPGNKLSQCVDSCIVCECREIVSIGPCLKWSKFLIAFLVQRLLVLTLLNIWRIWSYMVWACSAYRAGKPGTCKILNWCVTRSRRGLCQSLWNIYFVPLYPLQVMETHQNISQHLESLSYWLSSFI